ncbi:FUSC family protein [Phaeovibrio sulfidiphilus]|uniref:FUSC family protein n=1 Tax=Phaeovibrio sulfidiphilus TaxID=1220600 RepID=A0A8J6YPS6_9PROT|nr:FUSC family protein [Phaeovibrio sulfidiphilus]MBE1237734.1 FUSC family protein [Phaeovibrio sulfidiphilus]
MAARSAPVLPFYETPSFLAVVFSLKTWASAMLALWIAFFFDLAQPHWAMATVYIVAHPLSGALTSKAFYRLVGSLVGAVMSVALVPNLVNDPLILTLAIALWIAVALVVSLYDRTPRSYVFMLAGYSTAIISFPIVDTPEIAFTYSVQRALEIGLGILCAAFVSRVFFPRDAAPVVAKNLRDWLSDASRLGLQAFVRRPDAKETRAARLKLAADALTLRELTTQVAYDTGRVRGHLQGFQALQMRMMELLPLLSSIEDLVTAIDREEREDEVAEAHPTSQIALLRMREIVVAWLRGDLVEMSSRDRAECWRLFQMVAGAVGRSTYRYDLLALNLAQDILDFVRIRSECAALLVRIEAGETLAPGSWGFEVLPASLLTHTDQRMTLLSGVAVFVTTLVAVSFWRYTAWPHGASAAMMSAIFCCMFARMDDPVPRLVKQCLLFLVAFALTFVIAFALVPMVDDFLMLCLMFGLILVPLGTLIANPNTAVLGAVICIHIPIMLTIKSHVELDFIKFVNSNLAIIFGVYTAAAMTMLIRSVGAEWAGSRLLSAGVHDIVVMADTRIHETSADVRLMLYRMTDRFGLLAPRLELVPSSSEVAKADILKDLRIAACTARLNQRRHELPRRERQAVERVLRAIRVYYSEPNPARRVLHRAALLRIFDWALRIVSYGPISVASRNVRVALIGLSCAVSPSGTIAPKVLVAEGAPGDTGGAVPGPGAGPSRRETPS